MNPALGILSPSLRHYKPTLNQCFQFGPNQSCGQVVGPCVVMWALLGQSIGDRDSVSVTELLALLGQLLTYQVILYGENTYQRVFYYVCL